MTDRVHFSNIYSLNVKLFTHLTRFGKLAFFNFLLSFLSPDAIRSIVYIGCKLIFLADAYLMILLGKGGTLIFIFHI